jgi:four helix bundle protein
MAFVFEALRVYRAAERCLALAYQVAALLPAMERFNLADQLRRAALSVVLNIAEATERRSPRDRAYRIRIALGSLVEVVACLRAVTIAGHAVPAALLEEARTSYETLYRQLHAYRRSLRKGRRAGGGSDPAERPARGRRRDP